MDFESLIEEVIMKTEKLELAMFCEQTNKTLQNYTPLKNFFFFQRKVCALYASILHSLEIIFTLTLISVLHL